MNCPNLKIKKSFVGINYTNPTKFHKTGLNLYPCTKFHKMQFPNIHKIINNPKMQFPNIHKIINTPNINLNYLKTPCSNLTIHHKIKHHQFHSIILQIFKYRVLIIYTQIDCTSLTLLGLIVEEKAFGLQ